MTTAQLHKDHDTTTGADAHPENFTALRHQAVASVVDDRAKCALSDSRLLLLLLQHGQPLLKQKKTKLALVMRTLGTGRKIMAHTK